MVLGVLIYEQFLYIISSSFVFDRQFSQDEVSRRAMGPGVNVRQKRDGAQVMAALARELQHGPLRDPLMHDEGFGFLEVRNLSAQGSDASTVRRKVPEENCAGHV